MPRHSSRQHRGDKAPSTSVVYGLNPVREVISMHPHAITTVYVARDAQAVERLVPEARERGIVIEIVDHDTLDRMSGGGNHQGVAARTRAFTFSSLEEVIQVAPPLVVVLDGLTDPQNVGSIIRSAEVLGAGALVLPKDRSAAISPAVLRASSGAAVYLPVAQVVNVARGLELLKAAGYWIVGLDASGPSCFQDLPTIARGALVVGNEGKGIRPLVAKTCDFMVALPLRGRVASLNAAAAAAIGIYELAERVCAKASEPPVVDGAPVRGSRCPQ